MATKFVDDTFDHLESDIQKIRIRHRQYISYSNELGAKSVVMEILNNSLDECRNPRSPGNRMDVAFDERSGIISVSDNGRGIPTDLVEKIFTSLNMGSNIMTSNKASLKAETLGQNGTGSLAICGLAESVTITSNRGGTENKSVSLYFEEGVKKSESFIDCDKKFHGMRIEYKPSKVMGKNTKIIWKDIHDELLNLQYLNPNKIIIKSEYIDKKGVVTHTEYKNQPFENILSRNDKDSFMTSKLRISIDDDNIIEELDGNRVKRYLAMDVAYAYTSLLNPYMDSFSNSNNTVDNGDHLDGAVEALCRFFQNAAKSSMSEKERAKLDIKWDDVKTGLSVVVSLRTNYESLYTGQTKHKVVSKEVKKIILDLMMTSLQRYFESNPIKLKELIQIIKMNARVRRDGDRMRTAVVKNNLTNWSSYKMKNYDPCTSKGLKEYKELYIIEGDSAKGSLKLSRDPKFQALFAIRGVSANVFKLQLDQIVGPKGNKEFNDLITVMGCNVGNKFDLSKLQFDKIIIASDADVDGLFIRSLLMAFFFKLFPEIIQDGRLFIAEPPLYRVDDKKNPFVINKNDYNNRYATNVMKGYEIGYDHGGDLIMMPNDMTYELLSDTSSYVDDINMLVDHYKIKDRLIEYIIEAFAEIDPIENHPTMGIDMNKLIPIITEEFNEIYYDEDSNLIRGVIDGKYQSIETGIHFVRKIHPLIELVKKWGPSTLHKRKMILRDLKSKSKMEVSLLSGLKILKKYQPDIIHRFKGLGENDDEDIKITIMDPNTRTLIKVNIDDIENDYKIFNILRGTSPQDALNRKMMMKEYVIDKDQIDT